MLKDPTEAELTASKMANHTVADAHSIPGTNPRSLVDKILRHEPESEYWQEARPGLKADRVVERATERRFVGGVSGGNMKPLPFSV